MVTGCCLGGPVGDYTSKLETARFVATYLMHA